LARGLDSFSLKALFAGGLFLGLAFDAKEFYGLAFLPPLVLLARQRWGEKGRLLKALAVYCLGVSLPLLSYLLLKALILGSLTGAALHFLLQKMLLSHEFFTPLTIGRIYPESLGYLLRHPLFWLGGLGAYSVWRREATWGEKLWLWNFLLWTLFYVTAVWWHRFALPALFLAAPLASRFLGRVFKVLTASTARPPRWLAPGAAAAFLLLFYPVPAADLLGQIATRPKDTPYLLLEYLQQHVPRNCLIETPEYELVFLAADYPVHLMPAYFFKEATPDRIVLLNPREKPYDFNAVGADILIVGAFGKSVFRQVYPPSRINESWRLLDRVGDYDIYAFRGREKPRPNGARTGAGTPLAAPARPDYNAF
jgi:hypothetical protein